MPFLCTTIVRDGLAQDVTVHFSAHMTVPASRACWDDPGYPAEYDTHFEGAEFDCPDVAGEPLTEAEMAALLAWFAGADAGDRVWHAANDNHPDGPDPDAARDRANDDKWFGAGA